MAVKISQFKAGRPITVTLTDGTVVDMAYNPFFMVNENIDYYQEFLVASKQGGRDQTENAYNYIAGLLTDTGFVEDDGETKISSTADNLKRIGLDLLSLSRIHNEAFEDMNKRANPTPPTGEESSSGSTQTES